MGGGDKKLYPISCYGGVKNGPPKTPQKKSEGVAPRLDRVSRELLTLQRAPAEGGPPAPAVLVQLTPVWPWR